MTDRNDRWNSPGSGVRSMSSSKSLPLIDRSEPLGLRGHSGSALAARSMAESESGLGHNIPQVGCPKRRAQKQSRVNGFYDFMGPGEKRMALAQKVMNGRGPGQLLASPHDWLNAERRRAEDKAEERWRAKFEDMKRRALAEAAGTPSSDAGTRKPESDSSSPTATKSRYQQKLEMEREMMQRAQLEAELRAELSKERDRRLAVASQLAAMTRERDNYLARCRALDELLQKGANETKEAAAWAADLDRLVGSMGQVQSEPSPPQEEEPGQRRAMIDPSLDEMDDGDRVFPKTPYSCPAEEADQAVASLLAAGANEEGFEYGRGLRSPTGLVPTFGLEDYADDPDAEEEFVRSDASGD
eukprot:gnl/TRDRNA2_/TRDRNA2_193755_c0_seq1.p1 gnl/TRDRNA2_/TRDRNA2_193755_c0~~gnl/TRDRNA2_/TRDRNA2_193755_c0_seq1.p1  ORF type:complete len:371 (-),score=72.63 gnl/TRDRNA2_/TRDRNA2_193755_c0_seq1:111-1181(-)